MYFQREKFLITAIKNFFFQGFSLVEKTKPKRSHLNFQRFLSAFYRSPNFCKIKRTSQNVKRKFLKKIFNAFTKEWKKKNFSRLLEQKTFLSLLPPHRCFCTKKCTIYAKVCRAKEKAKFGAFNAVHCSFSSLYLHFLWTPEQQIVFHPLFLSRNKDFVASKCLILTIHFLTSPH